MTKDTKGFSVTALLLLLLAIGAMAGAGYYVYQRQKTTNDSARTSQDTQSAAEENRISVPEGWVTYKNEKLGIQFSYPSEWGEVREKETDYDAQNVIRAKGSAYTLEFSSNSSVSAGSYSDDWSLARGGAWFDVGRRGFDELQDRFYSKVSPGSELKRYDERLRLKAVDAIRTSSGDTAIYIKTTDASVLEFMRCSTHSYVSVNLKSPVYQGFGIAECGGPQVLKQVARTFTIPD